METYKIKVDPNSNDTTTLFCISLVDDPANMTDFIYMSSEKQELIKLQASTEKRQVTGVVLIPDQLVERYNKKTNQRFNIVFQEEEIRRLSIQFFKEGYQRNSNINHDVKQAIKGLTFFESWLVTDKNIDKATALGFDVPVGTWMATAYIEDDETWNKIKSGEVKGFSIECFVDLEKIEMSITNPHVKKDKMSLLKQLVKFFSDAEDIKMKTITSDLGELTVDSLEEGSLVTQEVDGQIKPLLNSVFVFEGMVYQTDADGKIMSIAEFVEEIPADDILPEAENVEDTTEEAAPSEEVNAEDIEAVSAEIASEVVEVVQEVAPEDWKSMLESITKQLDEVLKENEALRAELSSKDKEVEVLSKQPATTKLGMVEKPMSEKEKYFATLSRITRD